MKKIILTLTIAIFSFATYAQSSIFDKFEALDDVTTVVITKEAFKMASKFGGNSPEAKEYVEMVKGLDNLKVYTTEHAGIAKQMGDAVNSYLKTSKLSELMRVKDKDANVKIFIKPGKDENHVSELLMFVSDMQNKGNQEAVILSLTGEIDLNKISKITEGYIPNSGKQLKK
ncbi:MAG: DUF4252 domain-containing protein [Lutibacter sp.]|nr:DUF4252 domain-containing protein [Lutibacter sp.]MBP9601858.1 DUF4252 domain-containing protein [Lutibacter sp.]